MLYTFMGNGLEVGPGVLVPRDETELLGRTALSLIADIDRPLVVDMGTGSGNLALAVASAHTGATVYGGDITAETIGYARHNAERLGLTARAIFAQGDLFAALDGHGLAGRVDLVMANPPYISTHKLDSESAYLLENEPREAFDAGPYGILIHQRLISESPAWLRSGGWLAMEFGIGQERQMKALLTRARAYSEPVFHTDEEGRPRVVVAQKL